MNPYILIFFLLLSTASGNAQFPAIPMPKNVQKTNTIDSANIRILYALNAVDISNITTYDDLQRLEIGDSLSKYYSFFIYNSDSLITEWKNKYKNAKSTPGVLGVRGKQYDHWNEYHYSEYFKDFSSNTFTEYSRMPGFLQNMNCQYTEEMPSQNWTIHADTLTVLNYCCQKATCAFRGREYTAWFCIDIPINNGPWKFGGLPGLILKVYDKDHLFVFESIEIGKKGEKFPIKMYQDYRSYKKREREEVLKLQKEANENFSKTANLNLRKGTMPPQQPHFYMELE